MPDPSDWLDADEAARHLRLKPQTFQRLVRNGTLPAPNTRLGPRLPRWKCADLDLVMEPQVGSTDTRTAVHALAQRIATEGW